MILNSDEVEAIEKLRVELHLMTGKKYSYNKLLKTILRFWMMQMDVPYYDVLAHEDKKLGRPPNPKRKRGDRRERGEGEI